MGFEFPRIYPILDSSYIPASGRRQFLNDLGAALADAGVTLLEYRNKTGSVDEIRADAAVLRNVMPEEQVRLILDDRADLVAAIEFKLQTGDLREAPALTLFGRLADDRCDRLQFFARFQIH